MNRGLQRRADLNNETVALLLQAAAELFAEFGHENVSLRQLTSRAGVNVAAVNYYFGSKEALTEAVFEKFAQNANSYRRAELERLSEANLDPQTHLKELISALVDPYLGEGNEISGRLLARFFLRHRLHPTEGTQWITETYHNPVAKDYIATIAKLCPHIEKQEIYWRYMFMVNSLIISSAEAKSFERISTLSDGEIAPEQSNSVRKEELVRFLFSAFQSS